MSYFQPNPSLGFGALAASQQGRQPVRRLSAVPERIDTSGNTGTNVDPNIDARTNPSYQVQPQAQKQQPTGQGSSPLTGITGSSSAAGAGKSTSSLGKLAKAAGFCV